MFPLSPPSCSPPPIPLICVCAPRGLHALLRQTFDCDRASSRSRRQRLTYVFCDADETQDCRGLTQDAAADAIPKSGPAESCSASTDAGAHPEKSGTPPSGDQHTPPQPDQPQGGSVSSEKCVSARLLFPAEPPGSGVKREKGPQRKKIVSGGQLVNKGFLKHTWMQRMRTERPSCLILCFDWRRVYDIRSVCCGCCQNSASPLPDISARQQCSAQSSACCTRDGCRQRLEAPPDSAAAQQQFAAASTHTQAEDPRPGLSTSSGSESLASVSAAAASRTPGGVAESRAAVFARGSAVASAEAEAMAIIEFFRDRLQRRVVIPKMIVFVILPGGMEDPQSAVGFLKRLNPADIAAIFITCGVDDLKSKLEKLEQVSFECSVEYYENEARRYRKQTQVTFKGDRSQTSAFHVYQTRCLIKAGYMLEFAQQPHAAMKSYITAWQFLTSYTQMAPALERMTVCNLISVRMYPMYFKAKEPAKAAHHAREHRAVLRENIPESPLQGYLLPLWLAQLHQLLAQLCEEAMHSSPSSLDTRDVWQLAGFHYQAAARYLQHVRAWIRTAKEVHPPPSMKGGLGVPSQWLGQPDTLQHGAAAFATSGSQNPEAAAAAAQKEVFLRFIFFFNEAQVLTHATHLLSKAHIAYKLVGGYRSCPILACELADAMFDGHRMMTARQLYFTLATAFASHTYGHQTSWQLESKPAECTTAESGTPQQSVDISCHENAEDQSAASLQAATDGEAADPEVSSVTHATPPTEQPRRLSQPVANEPQISVGSSMRFSGAVRSTGWWPLYRYVLARLTLCTSHLLSIPSAEFLYEIARVDLRSSSAVGDQGLCRPTGGDTQLPSAAASTPGSHVVSTVATAVGAQADAKSCHIALKASFEILNLLALREDSEDFDGLKRKQMHQFVEKLLPLLRRFEQRSGDSQWLFHVDLHAVVVWTDLCAELHRQHIISGSGLLLKRHFFLPSAHADRDSTWEGVVIGRVCFQHRLGFDISVSNWANLVTSTGKKARCYLEILNCSQKFVGEQAGSTSPTEPASLTLPHEALCYCNIYLAPPELKDLSGATVRRLQVSWALCPSVCFQLATLCSVEGELSRLPGGVVAPSSPLKTEAVPNGCWPSPIRRAIRFHKLCIPPPPLCDVERPGLAEPFLPSLCLSKDSFELSTVGDPQSKYIWIGELAPYTVRLTVKQDWELCKFSIGVQCTAQESGSVNDRTVDTSVLLEDEFESFLIDSSLLQELDDCGAGNANGGEQEQTNGTCADLPNCTKLLRLPTNGSPCMPFTLTRDDQVFRRNSGQNRGTVGRERTASLLVFDPRKYSCKFTAKELKILVGEATQEAVSGGVPDVLETAKVVCIPMFLRLRRAGTFEVRVTVDVNLDDIVQRLTTSSSVECQRCFDLTSSPIYLPPLGTDGSCEAYRVNVTNVSCTALQLRDIQFSSLEVSCAPSDAPGISEPAYSECLTNCGRARNSLGQQLITPELPCTLLPGESWSGISRMKDSARRQAVFMKYARTRDNLPFPFCCVNLGITENLTIASLPPILKPLSLQCLQINVAHPITSAVGVPFMFSATFGNITREAMELLVSLSYPHEDGPNGLDSADPFSVPFSPTCPFMVGGQIKTQVIILPLSKKTLHWTLVPSRPGSYRLPTVRVEGKAKASNPGLLKGTVPLTAACEASETSWECASNPAHVLVFSK